MMKRCSSREPCKGPARRVYAHMSSSYVHPGFEVTANSTCRGQSPRLVDVLIAKVACDPAPTARWKARLTPSMIAPGKQVTLVGYPRRDGAAEMRIERITAGGKTVELR